MIIAGNLPDIDKHQHPTVALCFGLGGSLRLHDPNTGVDKQCENVLVPPEAPGPLIPADTQPFATIFISAEHPAYYGCLNGNPPKMAPNGVPQSERLLSLLRYIYREKPSFAYVEQQLEEVLESMPGRKPDPRIAQALSALRNEESGNLSLDAVARHVCLSPSRLVHLFKEETGVTFRRQRLWMRIVQSTTLGTRTQSLTDIASAAGFSDLAHYSRTFRSVFGLKPTSVIRFDGSLTVRTAAYEHRLGTPRQRSVDAVPPMSGTATRASLSAREEQKRERRAVY